MTFHLPTPPLCTPPLRTLSRRGLILAAPALLLPGCAQAQPAGGTPAQTEGPYYPRAIPADADADLRRVAGLGQVAQGRPLLLAGQVRNLDGAALPGAVVEIWQADHAGIYLHPREGRLVQRDTGFQGYGRVRADAEGRYAFRTIRPGQYPGRTPHIHLRAHPPAGGPALTTQVYFPDEPMNARDGLLRRVAEERRALLLARLSTTDEGQRAGFDIILT
ncbi:intradiol ring-cleavage dioxygenase [Roseomonas frigidaquae]|uniref:Intradiol ring-cleavage dioxygenase n=1 Tax=Falsiroseomonas frigidaquae TaxID=487318 RepID=A0ABX1F8W7_9PROT|nr:protocatechuate 3,4-dioxygenase [Falsiroseomonas frigidaquae]NKE48742.1 intradiol ring-cleavage dioxygenase [Falsiroseomonas frigidaquae]